MEATATGTTTRGTRAAAAALTATVVVAVAVVVGYWKSVVVLAEGGRDDVATNTCLPM